jgi:SsrA-binding protein
MSSTHLENKKARYNYTITDTVEAGLVLEGWEVKAFVCGKVGISESYVKIFDGEAYLVGGSFTKPGYITYDVQDKRDRKLLLSKRELTKFVGKVSREGYTIVPLSMYFSSNRKIKLKIGLGKGKKLYDKRADEKERDVKIQVKEVY